MIESLIWGVSLLSATAGTAFALRRSGLWQPPIPLTDTLRLERVPYGTMERFKWHLVIYRNPTRLVLMQSMGAISLVDPNDEDRLIYYPKDAAVYAWPYD